MIASAQLPLASAQLAIWLSAVFAATCLCTMLGLCLRRMADERRRALLQDQDTALLTEILTAIETGSLPVSITSADLDGRQLRRVFSHLFQLVRGEDRSRLIVIAEAFAIARKPLKDVTHGALHRRINAMRELEYMPVPRATQALKERMEKDDSPQARLEAAAILARMGELSSPAQIVHAFNLAMDVPNRLHIAMLRVAAEHHADELAELCEAEHLRAIRPILVEALGWSNDFLKLDVLARAAADGNPEVRASALKAARRLGHPGAEPWITGLLLDPVDFVRIQAVRSCGKLELVQAIPVITSLLRDSSWWVRMRATEALNALRPDQPCSPAVGLRQ